MEVAFLEYVLKTQNSFSLPPFKGATFRGTFGHHLKRTICVFRNKDCDSCQLKAQCPYTYLFASKNDQNEDVLRPFILKPSLGRKQFFLANETLYLQQILVGKAIQYLPYFVYTFLRMGERGIGRDRGRYTLEALYAVDAAGQKTPIFNPDNGRLETEFPRIQLDAIKTQLVPQVTVQLLTPTQIKFKGKITYQLDFPLFLKAILRRYHRLRYAHGDGKREHFAIDWEAADNVEVVHQEIEHHRFRRYSNRQGRPIPMQGVTGRIVYRGNLTPFYPWLKIGEYLHVGKGATFGMGWYRVV